MKCENCKTELFKCDAVEYNEGFKLKVIHKYRCPKCFKVSNNNKIKVSGLGMLMGYK